MLSHPWFWGALALLVLNDHLFKGSGLLPGWLTGKLSDVAGLLVAPLLLVAASGARRHLTRAACFAAVALPFVAIKLSPVASGLLVAAVARLGLTWQVVVDPLDLLGLAALPLAWWMLERTDRAPRRPTSWRWLERAGMGAGVVACLASSEPNNWSAQAYVVNRTGAELTLRMRPYAGQLDCDALGNDMVRALSPAGFAEGTAYQLGPDRTLPVRGQSRIPDPDAEIGPPLNNVGDCTVVLMQADGMPDMLVWWHAGDLSTLSVPVAFDEGEFESLGEGRIDINRYDLGRIRADNLGLAHVARAEREVEPSSCPANDMRYQHSVATPYTLGDGFIRAVDTLPDGCFDVALALSPTDPPGSGGGGAGGSGGAGGMGGAGGGGSGGMVGSGGMGGAGGEPPQPVEPADPYDHVQLCIPAAAWPFQVGAHVSFEVDDEGGLRIDELDGATLWVLPSLSVYSRADLGISSELTAVPCEGDRTSCNAFVVPARMSLNDNGATRTLDPGHDVQFDLSSGRMLTLWLGRAEQVIASHESCEPDRDVLGAKADLVVVEQ